MGIPKIYIGSYDAADGLAFGEEHSYLLYDPDLDGDSDPTTFISANSNSFSRIIRGGPESLISSGQVVIEIRNEQASSDQFDGESAADRHFRVLVTGATATSIWTTQMETFAASMGGFDSADNWYESNEDYQLLGPNSNSVVNSILNVIGYDFRDATPYNDGSTTTYKSPILFPGHMGLLDSSGNSLYTAYIYDGPTTDSTNFYKRNGNDTILLEWNSFTNVHAELDLYNTNNSTGLTTVYMDGLNFVDVSFTHPNDDLKVFQGLDELVRVDSFYADRMNDASEGAQTTAFEFKDIYYRRGDDNDNTLNASGIIKHARLEGFGGNDVLTGGLGDDLIIGGAGADWIYGGNGWGDGWDTVDYSQEKALGGSGAVHVMNATDYGSELIVTDSYGDEDRLRSIETLILTNGNDTVTYIAGPTPLVYKIDGGGGYDLFQSDGSNFLAIAQRGDQLILTDGGDYQLTLENFEEVAFSDAYSYATVLPDLSRSSIAPINVFTKIGGGEVVANVINYTESEIGGRFYLGGDALGNVAHVNSVSHVFADVELLYVPNHDNVIDIKGNSSLEDLYTGTGNDTVSVNYSSDDPYQHGSLDIYYYGGHDVYRYTSSAYPTIRSIIGFSDVVGVSAGHFGTDQDHVVITFDEGALEVSVRGAFPDICWLWPHRFYT